MLRRQNEIQSPCSGESRETWVTYRIIESQRRLSEEIRSLLPSLRQFINLDINNEKVYQSYVTLMRKCTLLIRLRYVHDAAWYFGL
jgi:hypothetical protein